MKKIYYCIVRFHLAPWTIATAAQKDLEIQGKEINLPEAALHSNITF